MTTPPKYENLYLDMEPKTRKERRQMETEKLRREMNRLYETEGLSKAFRLAHARYMSSLSKPLAKLFGFGGGKKEKKV